jgi:hypothetical protein
MQSSGRDCRALASSITASVTDEISVGDTSVPFISFKCDWISRAVIPPGVKRQNLVVKARPAGLVFGNQLRLEGAVAVTGNFYRQFAELPFERLPALPVARIAGRVLYRLILLPGRMLTLRQCSKNAFSCVAGRTLTPQR